MKIESITLENYGPFYGSHNFSFENRGLVLVMGDNLDEPKMDSNGSGKSSIFDALDWGLFGKVPRGDHADSICNEEVKACSVTIRIRDDLGNPSQITRSRGKKNDLVFVENGIDKTALDTKETQNLIEQYLGLDRDVFHAAVLFGQMDLNHYADATDSERMEILTKILNLDEIDELLDKAKAHSAMKAEVVRKIVADINAQTAVLDNIKSADYSTKINNWEETRRLEVLRLKELQASNQQHLMSMPPLENPDGLKIRLVELENQLAKIDDSASAFALTTLQNELVSVRLQTDYAQKLLLTMANQLAQQVDILNSPIQVCVSCGQAVPRKHISDKIADLEKGITEQKRIVNGWEIQLAQLSARIEVDQTIFDKQVQENSKIRKEHTDEITEIKSRLSTIQYRMAENQKIKSTIDNLQTMIGTKQSEVNPYIVQREENAKRFTEVSAMIDKYEAELSNAEEKQRYLDFWVTAFGTKGLKSYILDSRLQELTDAANQWVKILTGGTIWVQFESQKQTRGKKIVNSPDIRVCRWNPDGTISERNFKSWSGGEKQRISFAIDFGLSRLIANRAKHRYDLLILDEVFRHLDRSGKEAVMEMLQALATEKNSLLVVEHDTEFQGSFDSKVLVQKQNRRSVIKE